MAHVTPEQRRRFNLKTRYGITVAQYDELFKQQNGVCALCFQPSNRNRRLDVDHDHKTGRVRQLLCWNCNSLLGKVEQNPTWLTNAAAYLARWR